MPGYELTLIDRRAPWEAPKDGERLLLGDLQDPEFAAHALDGADAVVHLAGEPQPESGWSALIDANIRVTVNLLEAAAGGDRTPTFVLASSNHASGWYELQRDWPVDPRWPARPCCRYGASKAAIEAIGRWYSDAYEMSVTCLRLGWVQPIPRTYLGLAHWLSPDDLGRVVRAAIDARRRYGVYFAASANDRLRWMLDPTRRDLGYIPLDNAEAYVDTVDPSSPDSLQCRIHFGPSGGDFTT